MRILIGSDTDPCRNLAAEEYLMDSDAEDCFRLWRNCPSVIIGRNQNAWAEVNLPFVRQKGIPVVRRLSGGGAVFHDLGNVNFSFITDAAGEALPFARFLSPVIAALRAWGVEAVMDGRNDLLAGGCKISGNAQCVRRTPDGRQRLLHHGTLLFSADLSGLAGALRADPEKLRAKGVASVRSRVANLRDLPGYRGPRRVEAFIDGLAAACGGDGVRRGLSAEEQAAVARLAAEKYSRWEWNFGKSPAFSDLRRARYPFGGVEVHFTAAGGVLTGVSVTGDYFGTRDTTELEAALCGCPLTREALTARLDGGLAGACIAGMTAERFAALLLADERQTEEQKDERRI